MPEQDLEAAVREYWDVEGIVVELRAAEWEKTGRHRRDRRVYLGSYLLLEGLSKRASTKEWKEAVKEGVEHEIVGQYMEAVALVTSEVMGERVYSEISAGGVFVGQYSEDEASPPVPGVLDWMPED